MKFGEVLEGLKLGQKYSRVAWNNSALFIEYKADNVMDNLILPTIFLHTAKDELVVWMPSNTDLFAEDWINLGV
jgi:hypothetical protein